MLVEAPHIEDYAVLADGRTAALISRTGDVDWWCVPRLDHGACCARLLDDGRAEAGTLTLRPPDGTGATTERAYLDGTLVLETVWITPAGRARVLDLLVHPDELAGAVRLLRVVDGLEGAVDFAARIAPRFDFGAVRPWVRAEDDGRFSVIGGDDGLVVAGDVPLTRDSHDVAGTFTVRAGERRRLSVTFHRPEALDRRAPHPGPTPADLDADLDGTITAWRARGAAFAGPGFDDDAVHRSALTLLGLANPATGAIAAAATTSLPEAIGSGRTWDYRFSWIRDSAFAAHALTMVGFDGPADAFRRFVQRSAAGHADDLHVLYGLGGERRLPEQDLDHLRGYRGSRPVRIGNGAAGQRQLDAIGEIVALTWRWHRRGQTPDDDHWAFLVTLLERACALWDEPDRGLWEWRGDPRHFVHSKAMCWAALDRGAQLAEDLGRDRAPAARWRSVRDEIGAVIATRGVDPDRGCFVQTLDGTDLDGALLLLPTTGIVAWDDARMVRTVDAVIEDLGTARGLVRRYRDDDGMEGQEGAFLACSFWLAQALARQGRRREALAAYASATACANDVGLFSEEVDPGNGSPLGNIPQALTHLAHIDAALALARSGENQQSR